MLSNLQPGGEEEVIDLCGMSQSQEDTEPCPFCGTRFKTTALLQLHCEEGGGEEDTVDAGSVGAGTPGGGAPTAACQCWCGQDVPLAEFDSHQLAHELQEGEQRQQLEVAAAAAAAGEGGEEGEEERLQRRQIEELYFEELRARYGFQAPVRSGTCFVCGEQGHWTRDCPKSPHNTEARRRVVRPPLPERIAAAQQRAEPTAVGGGLIPALAACLRAQQLPPGVEYRAALCGPLDHFAASAFDSGWGCGYRNIQTLSSYLLGTREEARAALFAGCGFVPDIPALAAWIEAAWAAGFDPQGAEQLESSVQASHKWIGTTDAAALLRSFGLRARVVDFGVQQGQGNAAAAPGPTAAAATAAMGRGPAPKEVHPRVECNSCGVVPIVGGRYKSSVLPDYDLCEECYHQNPAPTAAPFCRMLPGRMQEPATKGNTAMQSATPQQAATAEQLVQWVWRYFTEESDPIDNSGAATPVEQGRHTGPKRPRLEGDRVMLTSKSPCYFQHEGHSRTIIGIEQRIVRGRERRVEHSLLVLDPGTPPSALAGALAKRAGWQRVLKRGMHTLRKAQYQLLHVEPGLATGEELAALKAVVAHDFF